MYASTQKGELTMSEVITMKRNNSDENTTLAMLANDRERETAFRRQAGGCQRTGPEVQGFISDGPMRRIPAGAGRHSGVPPEARNICPR